MNTEFLKFWELFILFLPFFTNQTLLYALRQKCLNLKFFSDPDFPATGLHRKLYFVNLRMQSECSKIRTRKNSELGHFHVTMFKKLIHNTCKPKYLNCHTGTSQQQFHYISSPYLEKALVVISKIIKMRNILVKIDNMVVPHVFSYESRGIFKIYITVERLSLIHSPFILNA